MAFRVLPRAVDAVGAGGQFWIFALAQDGQMIYKYWDGSAWQPSQTGWNSLGGSFLSAPACSVRNFTYTPSEAQIDVVAVGTIRPLGLPPRQVLYHQYWNGRQWNSDWQSLGGLPTGVHEEISFAHPVAITSNGVNLADVVAVGSDNQAYHTYLSGPATNPVWQPWENLGGSILSAPAVAGMEFAFNLPGQVLAVFGTDSNSHVVYKYTDGSAWQPSQSGWENLDDSEVFFNVASGGTSDTQLDVLGTAESPPGQQQRLFHKAYQSVGTGQAWTPAHSWQFVANDDFLLGRPVVVEIGTPLNRLDVFVGLGHSYLPQYQNNWLSDSLGGNFDIQCAVAAAGVYPAIDTAILHVVVIADTGPMMHIFYDGNGWQPNGWESVGQGLSNAGFLIPAINPQLNT